VTATDSSRRAKGFTFVEILIVMGIIAVLAGMVIVAIQIWARKGPEQRTRLLLIQLRSGIDAWQRKFHTFPPTDLSRLPMDTGMPLKIAKLPNTVNLGSESMYQSQYVPGYSSPLELKDGEDGDVGNTDDDRLDKAFNSKGSPELYEVRDAWGNPLVYFRSDAYATAKKDPPLYISTAPEAPNGGNVNPKPYEASTGGYVNPNTYQLYSMGPDGIPNTEDDIRLWD
jgi:prepilin-type N-terminal cleavage/methylation domain-containing protein